jgi:hypothetical protein
VCECFKHYQSLSHLLEVKVPYRHERTYNAMEEFKAVKGFKVQANFSLMVSAAGFEPSISILWVSRSATVLLPLAWPGGQCVKILMTVINSKAWCASGFKHYQSLPHLLEVKAPYSHKRTYYTMEEFKAVKGFIVEANFSLMVSAAGFEPSISVLWVSRSATALLPLAWPWGQCYTAFYVRNL